MKRNVGILIFDDAEVLDFAGPFEVFSVTSELNNFEYFDVFTIAKSKHPVSAVNGLSVNPKYDFSNHPAIDILILSGGGGTRRLLSDIDVLNWISETHLSSELTLSICSGARLLAKIGLLDRRPYCTHNEVYDDLEKLVSEGVPLRDSRFIQSSRKIYTSGGISAGIDLSFHIVEKLLGAAVVEQTAAYMEYRRIEF